MEERPDQKGNRLERKADRKARRAKEKRCPGGLRSSRPGDRLVPDMSEPATYPPDPHIVRDLASVIKRDENESAIYLPIVPELLDDSGRLRVGVAATAVDIICGETAIRNVIPDWVATLSLSLQVGDMPAEGTLVAKPRILRQGRTTLVQEVEMTHHESGTDVGLGTVAFSILPGRTDGQPRVAWIEELQPETTFASEGSGFKKSIHETLGFRFEESPSSIVRADVVPYVINTLGAMQGGAVAILIDAAGDRHASIEAAGLGHSGPTRVRSLEIHYLKLARVGPIRATARTVGELGSGRVVRVELRDEGQADQLVTVASLVIEHA